MTPEERSPIVVEDEALRSGFTMLPNAILRRPDLTPGAKLAYMGLLSYAWQADSCFPGQDRLADDLGISARSVWSYLKQLEECGLISIRRRGLGMTNLYVIHRVRFANPANQESQAERTKNTHTE